MSSTVFHMEADYLVIIGLRLCVNRTNLLDFAFHLICISFQLGHDRRRMVRVGPSCSNDCAMMEAQVRASVRARSSTDFTIVPSSDREPLTGKFH